MNEQTIWYGKPSHLLNLKTYFFCTLFCWLILPIFVMLWRMIQLKSTSYELTNQRLIIKTDVFSRVTDELELHRIRDYRLVQPFLLRLIGRSNIVLYTTDRTDHEIHISAIRQGQQLREVIRQLVEARRSGMRVSEVDLINYLN